MFTFTPLQQYPLSQSILEFDGGIKILVDVGWDDSFDADKLAELERQIPTVSIILLTHATISHIGAYAHCCKHIPLFSRIPVYATTPVISLGRSLLQDLYKSTPLASSLLPSSLLEESVYSLTSYTAGQHPKILLPPPSLEDITNYFSLINPLKYSQPHQPLQSSFSPPLDGLSITAYCAGHTLGGTIWHIQYGSESVVHAVDWNQARENVLPGAAWLGGSGATGNQVIEQLRQPTALVCSSRGGESEEGGSRKQRDELVQSHIQKALQQGGNVLIPCDTGARVLELSYMLERCWETVGSVETATSLERAKLYLASPSSNTTMRYARSMLEWMDESIVREFEAGNTRPSQNQNQPNGVSQNKAGQPFEFKYLKLLEKRSELNKALATPGPKVFLASDTSMEWGFAKDVVRQLCGDERNLVIVTGKSALDDAAASATETKILDALWKVLESGRQQDGASHPAMDADSLSCNGKEAHVHEVETTPLEGHDLTLYQQYLARQRQRYAAFSYDGASTLETSADAVDDGSSSTSSSSEESDAEQQGKALNVSAALTHSKHKLGLTDEELGVNILLRRKNVHDYDVRGKKGREKMFPFVTRRRREDDFGDLIRPEDYLRAEEREEVDGQDVQNNLAKADSGLGQKRKWGDKDDGKVNRGKKSASKISKRAKAGRAQGQDREGSDELADAEDVDESDESDDEGASALSQGPTKATVSTETIRLQLKVANVDFSGLHDQRTLRMLIPLIRPRKLILTGGSDQEVSALAEGCRQLLNANDATSSKSKDKVVLTPSAGDTVDASVDTNAWTVKLSQGLFKHLRWQNFRGLGIVTINGRLGIEEAAPQSTEEGAQKRQKLASEEHDDSAAKDEKTTASGNETAGTPILSELPLMLAGSARSATHALHVGDLRLAELRKIMQANGHTAEFKGEGTLLVDGLIAVRKSAQGKIEVEAGGFAVPGSGVTARQKPDASFAQVKKKIYEGLAVVAAR